MDVRKDATLEGRDNGRGILRRLSLSHIDVHRQMARCRYNVLLTREPNMGGETHKTRD